MIWTEQEQIDVRSVLSQAVRDVLMHSADVVDPVKAPRHARLVRQDGDRYVGPVERRDRFR